MKKDCVFCNKEIMNEYKLFETDNFIIKLGLAIAAPGQVMLISKKHYACFAELPDEFEQEFQEAKKKLIKLITENFSEPFLIEMGSWCQTVPHAHIHFIPSKSDEYKVDSIVEEMLVPSGVKFELIDKKRLKEIYKDNKGYVFVEEKGKSYACLVKGLPFSKGQTEGGIGYRQFLTFKKSLKGVSAWKNMSDEDKKLDEVKRKITIEKLTSALVSKTF